MSWREHVLSQRISWTERRAVLAVSNSNSPKSKEHLPRLASCWKELAQRVSIIYFSIKFREQIQELVQKNATALGAQKKLEAELSEVSHTPTVCGCL